VQRELDDVRPGKELCLNQASGVGQNDRLGVMFPSQVAKRDHTGIWEQNLLVLVLPCGFRG